MPSQNGNVYGLTILSPILNDGRVSPSHDLQIRAHLAGLPTGADSPFARVEGTHLCRLVVMDDVVYVGAPACEEHLKSKYLIFESNLDCGANGDIDAYLRAMAANIPEHLDAIWKHCAGYPGAADANAFVKYMQACRLDTTFFFAAVNDKTVAQSLKALQTQKAVAEFIATHQGLASAALQAEFIRFAADVKAAPTPLPGAGNAHREIKTGGHNE